MTKPKIILAGYGSWAKAAKNPAGAIAVHLNEQGKTCDLIGLELAVNSDTIRDDIDVLLRDHKPDAWVGIGVSSAGIIKTELVGINWRNFGVPDVTGQMIRCQPVLTDGPAAYNATLPHNDIVTAITDAGIPADVSFHAGTHLCNQMLYTAGHLIETQGLPTLNGFIHVPQTPENVMLPEGGAQDRPSMPLPMMIQAVSIAVDTIAQTLTGASQGVS